jgi:hypothetical protein
MDSGNFVLGPYTTRRRDAAAINESIEDTGCALHFVTAQEHTLELFRMTSLVYRPREFSAYVVREREIPFGIECFAFQVKDLAEGPYITLSAFLSELYTFYPDSRSIVGCLVDLSDSLSLPPQFSAANESAKFALRPPLPQEGFAVSSVLPYGRRIFVDFSWTPPGVNNGLIIAAGGVEFRPQPDKTLGHGTWYKLRTHATERLIFEHLRRLGNGLPVDVFTADGRSAVLNEFEWTPLALMTAKEAREARVQFVRSHPELLRDNKALAKAMKNEQLYSDDTSVSQIARFLPGLLKAASISAN